MRRSHLVLRGLAHFRWTHVGTLLGVAVGSAVLTGALLVGDSVRHSLAGQARQRIGRADLALASGPRLFRSALADAVAQELGGEPDEPIVAPALMLRGIASASGGSRRALDVQVLGVDRRFCALAPGTSRPDPPATGEVHLNQPLASRLRAEVGDRIVLRVEDFGPGSGEAVLVGKPGVPPAFPLQVARILSDDQLGRFDLTVRQTASPTALVLLPELQSRLGVLGRANLCLVGGAGLEGIEAARAALRRCWSLEDAGLEVRELTGSDALELTSERILLDPELVEGLARSGGRAMGVFTWLANELRVGERSVPYSLISALGPATSARREGGVEPWQAVLPADTREDEIVINEWLAEELAAGVGDSLELSYWTLGPRQELTLESCALAIRGVVPVEGLAADRELMPPFPGLADSESCSQWDPGVPIDLSRIRDRDEEWWNEHGGTPKAFVTLAAGMELWGSERFGSMTAVRFAREDGEELLAGLRQAVDPAALGLSFRDLRGPALAASAPATDFGGLFLGLSFFLMASAFLLVGLLLALSVLQRSAEIGTLLSLGFRPGAVRRLLLAEGAALALVGSALGAVAGVGYARLLILALSSIWREAVASSTLVFHARPSSVLLGGACAFLVALACSWIALRRRAALSAVDLLAQRAGVEVPGAGGRRRSSGIAALVFLLAAGAVLIWGMLASGPARPLASFLAGVLALVGALAAARFALLGRGEGRAAAFHSLGGLAWSHAARSPARSLAAIALLACGSFLVIVVGAHRKVAPADPLARLSGTGGFALVGRSSLAVVPDRATEGTRAELRLTEDQPPEVSVVPLRVRDGDDASCLNLNRPQAPRLLGVRPQELARRGAFAFAGTLAGGDANPWLALADASDPDVVPAIGDEASLTWSLHRALGDTVPYVDERGRAFEVRIVGALAGSILQGDLVIDESRFRERFPSEAGYRMFLVDAPLEEADALAAGMMRELEDVGLELVLATSRLAELGAVQNAYLIVFQVLGGLGLLLGSAGLGVVVLRNVAERRGELAALAAIGFRAGRIRGLLLVEHGFLLLAGTAGGALAALVATVPMLRGAAEDPPLAPVLLLLGGMLLGGLLWVGLATRLALRGAPLEVLGREG